MKSSSFRSGSVLPITCQNMSDPRSVRKVKDIWWYSTSPAHHYRTGFVGFLCKRFPPSLPPSFLPSFPSFPPSPPPFSPSSLFPYVWLSPHFSRATPKIVFLGLFLLPRELANTPTNLYMALYCIQFLKKRFTLSWSWKLSVPVHSSLEQFSYVNCMFCGCHGNHNFYVCLGKNQLFWIL